MSMDMADSFISVEGSMGDEERQQEKWATIEEEEAEYDEDDEDEAEIDGIGADMGDVASPSKKRRGVKRRKPRNHEVCDGHDHASHHASQSFDKSPSVGRGECESPDREPKPLLSCSKRPNRVASSSSTPIGSRREVAELLSSLRKDMNMSASVAEDSEDDDDDDDDGKGKRDTAFMFTRRLKRSVFSLALAAKQDERLSDIVDEGGVRVAVELLRRCIRHHHQHRQGGKQGKVTPENILKNTCLIVGLLAMHSSHRRRIIQEGGISSLVTILRAYSALSVQSRTEVQPVYTLMRRTAGALTNLAHEDAHAKNVIRDEGGIPPLVLLLRARECSVQIAAAGTLKAIAFRNEDNKNQIIECGALPALVTMLRASDPLIHYEAVAVLSNLVHSSAHIKKLVLNDGALQPLVNLLSSTDTESRREAALLLGQFANVQEPDYKTKIVQRGALGPLISMLSEENMQVSEMAAFAIGRLAQNADNQAGIVQAGGLTPLLQLLDSPYLNPQHNAAFALYGLSDNDDNVHHFLKSGAVSQLMSGEFHVQASKDCVKNTLKKLEEKIAQGHVLSHLKGILAQLDASDSHMSKHYIASGLAFLAPQHSLYSIFIEHGGLDVLLESALNHGCKKCQREGIDAVHTLGKKVSAFNDLPTVENGFKPGQVVQSHKKCLGGMYLNNPEMSDVHFQVDGKGVYAHKLALLSASSEFAKILEQQEHEVSLGMDVLRYVYTGTCDVNGKNAQSLLVDAEEFKLNGLKFAAETFLVQNVKEENLFETFELATRTNAAHLKKAACHMLLKEWQSISQSSSQECTKQKLEQMLGELRDILKNKCCLSTPSAAARRSNV